MTTTRTSDAYELSTVLDGTSWAVRENLHDVLVRELLGPGGGDVELLDVPPDTRYILGRIAPTKLTRSDDAPTTEGDDDASTVELGDDLAALESSGVPLSDVDDTTLDGDEDSGGDRDDEPVRRGLMIPASMGLRFQVPRDLPSFTVRASWGVYSPEKTGEVDRSGRTVRKYRRTPIDVPVRVDIGSLVPGQTTELPLHDDVMLRIDAYHDAELDRLLVEVALCNDRQTPRQIPTNAWMFQTRLHIEAGGEAAFLPVRDVTVDTRRDTDDELNRLALQYRDRLEFAIGRTCSVDWHQVPGTRRADRVWTTGCPPPRRRRPQPRTCRVPCWT